MFKSRIEVMDGDLGFCLPAELVVKLGIVEGDELTYVVEDGILILSKKFAELTEATGGKGAE
jgi:antitoxin component of MazEF toxin-antitoxin module